MKTQNIVSIALTSTVFLCVAAFSISEAEVRKEATNSEEIPAVSETIDEVDETDPAEIPENTSDFSDEIFSVEEAELVYSYETSEEVISEESEYLHDEQYYKDLVECFEENNDAEVEEIADEDPVAIDIVYPVKESDVSENAQPVSEFEVAVGSETEQVQVSNLYDYESSQYFNSRCEMYLMCDYDVKVSPDPESDVLCSLPAGSKITVVGMSGSSPWLQISVNEQIGYINIMVLNSDLNALDSPDLVILSDTETEDLWQELI